MEPHMPHTDEPIVRLIDMVFPGDTNHHGTLFGGVALAHMDKSRSLPQAGRQARGSGRVSRPNRSRISD